MPQGGTDFIFGVMTMPSPLQDKSKAFALEIIKVCNEVKRSKRESVLTNQLIRSGTSVGANIREAMYAHGKADFIAKLQIALKECSESEYWLELLIESGYYDDSAVLNQCTEVKRLLIASINTAKKNQIQGHLYCFAVPNQSTNFDTKTAFHFGGLFLRLCPEPQYSCGFRPFPAVAPNGRKNTAGGIIWIIPA